MNPHMEDHVLITVHAMIPLSLIKYSRGRGPFIITKSGVHEYGHLDN